MQRVRIALSDIKMCVILAPFTRIFSSGCAKGEDRWRIVGGLLIMIVLAKIGRVMRIIGRL